MTLGTNRAIAHTFFSSLGQRALKRLAANQNDDDPDNVDWSLRRVVEASVVSPIRDTKSNNVKPANEGFFVGRNHWQGTKSEAHQPPLNRTISNGYPPRNPVIPIPPPVAFESRNQENAVYRKPGPRMWNFEVSLAILYTVITTLNEVVMILPFSSDALPGGQGTHQEC